MNNSLGDFSKDKSSPNHGEPHKAPRSFISPSVIVGPTLYGYWYTRWETRFQQFLMK